MLVKLLKGLLIIPFLEKHSVKLPVTEKKKQSGGVYCLSQSHYRVNIFRIILISKQFWLKAQSFPSRNSFLVPDSVTFLAPTSVMAWQRTQCLSGRHNPGALSRMLGRGWSLEKWGLSGVACVLAEVWAVVMSVDWQVNIQRLNIWKWNLKGLAKCFFICWRWLEQNETEEKL